MQLYDYRVIVGSSEPTMLYLLRCEKWLPTVHNIPSQPWAEHDVSKSRPSKSPLAYKSQAGYTNKLLKSHSCYYQINSVWVRIQHNSAIKYRSYIIRLCVLQGKTRQTWSYSIHPLIDKPDRKRNNFDNLYSDLKATYPWFRFPKCDDLWWCFSSFFPGL